MQDVREVDIIFQKPIAKKRTKEYSKNKLSECSKEPLAIRIASSYQAVVCTAKNTTKEALQTYCESDRIVKILCEDR